jgi:transcriptional regulator with XRE-family HTH domain
MTPDEFKVWREAQGLTQHQAAEELGISVSAVANYEHGVRRGEGEPAIIPKAIEKACSAFDKRQKVKTKIAAKINANGKGGITGPVLREILLEIVDAM